MRPTKEQITAINAALEGKTFKISAYAGSGKTSTLKFIGSTLNDQQGIYLAFNKAIAEEAKKKFPKNIKCQTFHSLAFRQTPDYIKEKLNFSRLLPRKMAEMLSLQDYKVPLKNNPSESDTCTAYDQAMILNRAIGFYCRSIEETVTPEIIIRAMPEWINKPDCIDLINHLVSHANTVWNKYIDEHTRIKITHDVYLKHWAMGNPEIHADFILFDEAQDADPIMLDVLNKQSAQVIYVGDRHQQIYAFRGAVNAMQSLDVYETRLTKSFRFGGDIAVLANILLANLLDESTPLVGNETIDSKICILEKADAYLARTNAGAFLMALQLVKDGYKPRLEIDVEKLLLDVQDAEKLQDGIPLNKTSEFYGFSSWGEVEDFVKQNPSCDIAPLVALIERNGTEFLISTLNTVQEVTGSDCTVSTAHKSKGLEFSSVKLCSDFFWNFPSRVKKPDDPPIMSDSEARLFYVACTRAINYLDISEMRPFFSAFKDQFYLNELNTMVF